MGKSYFSKKKINKKTIKVSIQSEFSVWKIIETILVVLFFGAIFLYLANNNKFLFQIGTILLLCFFAGIALSALLSLRHLKRVEILDDEVMIKTLRDNLIHSLKLKDIIKWHQTVSLYKKRTFKLYTTEKKVLFKSNFITNYREISDFLEKQLGKEKRDTIADIKAPRSSIYIGVGILFFGALITPYSINSILISFNDLQNRLISFDIKLDEKPRIHRSKNNIYLKLISQKQPELEFQVNEFLSQCDYQNYIREYNPSEKSTITIHKNDYEKYVSKTIDISFWDKQVNYNQIEVYGLRHNGVTYLNIEDSIDDSKSIIRNLVYIGFALLGIVMILGAFFVFLDFYKSHIESKKELRRLRGY